MSEHDELVPIGKAAHMLGVSTRTVLRWTDDGKLTLATLSDGGHRRYRLTDVQALVAERAA